MSIPGQESLRGEKLISLQVLRGFAAFLIVLFHAIHDVNSLYALEKGALFPNPTALIYGIDLFFVISGFIMVYTAYGKTGVTQAKGFLLRRIIRVVPLYWFFTFVLLFAFTVMPLIIDNLSFSPEEFIKSLLFIPYRDSVGGFYPFLKIGWTLNYEMYFYGVFALCMLLPIRFFMPALSVFFLVTLFAKSYVLPEGIIREFYGNMIILNFLVGAWIGYIYKKGWRLPSKAVFLGFAFVFISFIWSAYAQEFQEKTGVWFPRRELSWLSVALLVLPKGVSNIKFPKWSIFIGDSSYSLYLAHSFAIGALIAVISVSGIASILSPWLVFVLCIVVAIIAGSLSYLLIEKPLLSASKRLISSRK